MLLYRQNKSVKKQINMSAEIVIYIQKIKTYFRNFEEVRKYFIQSEDVEDLFFSYLEEYVTKQYYETGNAMLTKEHFEEIRNIVNKKNREPIIDLGIWGFMCLN
jgi:hypothetical protein